ncbi:MAG: hypothetical protein LBK94_06635 [Prevotellaceae bacterium]|jgi:hypothetical protein|nr:hypothetical protein [Prevotellaceae bacterium]
MTENKVKRGDIIVYTYDYFSWIHYDNRKGIITDSDYLTFNKQQLIYFFSITKIQNIQNININIVNNYGNLNKEDIENLFNWIRFIIINDVDYNLWYKDIKEYVLIDCVPKKRFYSSIQWKNNL